MELKMFHPIFLFMVADKWNRIPAEIKGLFVNIKNNPDDIRIEKFFL